MRRYRKYLGFLFWFLIGLPTVLFLLDKTFALLPQPDIGFSFETATERLGGAVLLSRREGNPECWVRIVVCTEGGSKNPAFVVAGHHASACSVNSQRLGPGRWELEIVATPGRPQKKDFFFWAPGRPLHVKTPASTAAALSVEDWSVFMSNGQRDSRTNENLRRTGFTVLLALLVLGVAGKVYEKVWAKSEEFEPHAVAASVVRRAIAAVEGQDADETRKMQKFLRGIVLRGITGGQAKESIGLSSDKPEDLSIVFMSKHRFDNNLKEVLAKLRGYLS